MLKERYNFQEIEAKCRTLWEKSDIYKWKGEKDETFIIDTPPPTISGRLHLGHIFSYCHTDFIARFQRMLGKDVFYPIGFDDNGLPTERLVEQIYKTNAREVSRERFTEMCHKVIGRVRQEFIDLFKLAGISYDWSQEYHTMSKKAITLSQMSFIDLYNKKLIYRKMQPILWDTVDKTAISQAEVELKIYETPLSIISFSTEENDHVKIATTRPELLPACVAVFCHPKDVRYTHLIGKSIRVAIIEEKVPVIADDKVKIDKGTGLVMCCTFGDELDIYWQQKYNLPIKIIINKDGEMNLSSIFSSNKFQLQLIHWICSTLDGLKVEEARKRILRILSEKRLLVENTNIFHSVKCAERSGSPLEILPTYQWFVKTLDQKIKILNKVRECNWYPISMRKRMETWIDKLNWDWCISRQRYFGVPFPVWYSKRKGEEGKAIIAEIKDLPIDPLRTLPRGYSKEEIISDQDVMDTWATSAITPQLGLLAVNKESCFPNHFYEKIFPVDLRSQSHEIIRTWAFYTILKAYYHTNSLPWKNIMISGWCLTKDKKKMSKSKGSIITPNSILRTYGADIVRYWAANSRLGVDTVYSEDVFRIGRRLITKLWNASKFVSIFIEKDQVLRFSFKVLYFSSIEETMDKWILSKLYELIDSTTKDLLLFEYYEALKKIEGFFWKDFCSNYLELVKRRAYGRSILNAKASLSAKKSLVYILYTVLRLLAPFLPYITEELYNQLYCKNSIHNQKNWPSKDELIYDSSSKEIGDNVIQILNLVRKIKADNNMSISSLVKMLMIKTNIQKGGKLDQSAQNDLQMVCNAEIVQWSPNIIGGLKTENGKFTVHIEL